MYEARLHAELAVVRGMSHFLTQAKPQLVNQLVLDFLSHDPVQMVAPIGRHPAAELNASCRRVGPARRADRRLKLGTRFVDLVAQALEEVFDRISCLIAVWPVRNSDVMRTARTRARAVIQATWTTAAGQVSAATLI